MLSENQVVKVRNAMQSLWVDTFDLFEQKAVKQANFSTDFQEVKVLENIPCKLSFSSTSTVTPSNDGQTYSITQNIKLFCDLDVDINAGSKIIIKSQGKEFTYCKSGEPSVFATHQEVVLTVFKEYV